MTRPADQHLNADELGALVYFKGSAPSSDNRLSDEVIAEAKSHVKTCLECDRKVQMHKSAQTEISSLRTSSKVERGPNCSDRDEWIRLVAGLAGEGETKERMKHAAQCGHCGPLLKAASEILSDETTAEEEGTLANLASTRPGWQAHMAATLGRRSAPGRPPASAIPFWKSPLYWPRSAFAVAAAVLFAVVGWIGVRSLHRHSAEELLAEAYAEHRTIEIRIPNAKYAPLRVERSGTASNFDKPQSLLKAEALISENLRRHPDDPEWLEAKSRAELLDGSYDDAIKTLQRVLESKPNSPQVLTDLGSAYFLRAQSANRPIDYGNAIEFFGKALAKTPNDPIALFNRALACEQIFLYAQSIDDWDHYLRIDPQGGWADEARKRVAALRNKVQQRDQSRGEKLAIPSLISETPEFSAFDTRLEEYLDRAVAEWLPTLVSSPQLRGLKVLSHIATERHNDPWLDELLAGSTSKEFSVATKELSAAVLSNERADTGNARVHAARAAKLFTQANNQAGAMRAQIEVLAALNTDGEGGKCSRAVESLANAFRRTPYRWLRARFQLEAGTCAWTREELGLARSEYRTASKEAKANGFQLLYLRTQDRLAGLDAASGSMDSAWRKTTEGLAAFWSGSYPDVRGYNFYVDICELTRVGGLWQTQVAAWRDGIRFTESSPDIAQRAMAHLGMGNAAQKAGLRQISATEFARAEELFRESPQIPTTQLARLEAQIRLAGVQVSDGDFRSSMARIKPLQGDIDRLADNYLGILFYTTLGEAEGVGDEWTDAENDLRKAISLAQKQVGSLADAKSRFQVVQESARAYRALVQRLLLKGETEAALDLWESYKAVPLGLSPQATQGQVTSAASSKLQLFRYLPTLTNQTAISYAVLPQGLAIWVVDDHGVYVHWDEGRNAQLIAAVSRLRELSSDPHSDQSELQRNARTLYDILIAPVRNRLDAARVIVADLDDGLDGLPLESLIDEKGRYFGDIAVITTSLGLYYRGGFRAAFPFYENTPALIVGVPNATLEIGEELPSLPDALEEAEIVNRSFTGATLLEAGDATRESILARLPGVKLFHFAGHAIYTTAHSGLLLSDSLFDPSLIPVRTISQLQLAVFSACETQNGSGDVESPVRVFLQAGVPNVVASRWKVDSGATRQFMQVFYSALLEGNSVPVAVHLAESKLRSNARTSHPYYWSAFGAFGAA